MCDDEVIQVWRVLFPANISRFERVFTTREQYHVPYFVLLQNDRTRLTQMLRKQILLTDLVYQLVFFLSREIIFHIFVLNNRLHVR